ncbi:MAG TPA: M48 family metalloprotease [Capsulimonadaceae bacterium]|nr:M48 family metalloprotease [Capsulimonadaceae bacterium]
MTTQSQTMNFFASEDVARKRTAELALLFVLAALLEIAGFSLIAAAAAIWVAQSDKMSADFSTIVKDCLLYVSPIVLAILVIGFISRLIQLRGGGSAIAEMLDGELLPAAPQDLGDKTLRDVVDEMAIAAGVSPPAVYVLRDEASINAFSAGQAGKDAVIGVTAGALEKLSRDELQGVIAHEFSHILNRDTVLNMRTLAVVYALASISFIGYVLFRITSAGRWDRKSGSIIFALFAAGAALVVLGLIGGFLGRLVRASVTRQRESLADASAVQFTRNPQAVAAALYKIETVGSLLTHHRTEELNHFLFADGIDSGWHKLRFLATHPPIKDRIRAVDPSFLATHFTWTDNASPDPPPN